MADEQLLMRLIQDGVDSWNQAREQARSQPSGDPILDSTIYLPDFSDANFWWSFRKYGNPRDTWPISLAGIDLVEADLTHAMLRLVNLSNAELAAADMTSANLNETILVNAEMQDADLQNARMNQANMTGADLRGAVLTGADLYRSVLTKANLTTADLVGADLTGTNVWQAILFPSDTTSPTQYQGQQRAIRSITDLLMETRKLKRHHNRRDKNVFLYFRGEPNCDWDLKPSVMRGNYIDNEGSMLLDLISRRPEEFSQMPSALSQWVLARFFCIIAYNVVRCSRLA